MNFHALRKVAKSNKYQILYNRAKNLGTIKLFSNDVNYTQAQIWFLYWLEVYSSLYTDLAMNEKYIDEEVIEDDLRTDAYILYRQEKRKEKPKLENFNKKKEKVTPNNIPTIRFRSK